jgi:hypothetical protein
MKPEILDYMIALAKDVGEIKKINMYSENSIYIVGKTNDGKVFNLNLTTEEEKENA